MDKKTELLNVIPEEIRDVIKSLSDDVRLAIMVSLMIEVDKNGIGKSFNEIKKELEISQGSLSNHLKKLLESGLIENEYRKIKDRKEYSFYMPTTFGRKFMFKILELTEEAAQPKTHELLWIEEEFQSAGTLTSSRTKEQSRIELKRGERRVWQYEEITA